MKVIPIGNNILIAPPKNSPTTKSGIYVPKEEHTGGSPEFGVVVAVGDEVKKVKVGAEVFYTKYGPSEIVVEKEKYVVAKEGDILVIVKK